MIHQPSILIPFSADWQAGTAPSFTVGYGQVSLLFGCLHLLRTRGGKRFEAMLPPPIAEEPTVQDIAARRVSWQAGASTSTVQIKEDLLPGWSALELPDLGGA